MEFSPTLLAIVPPLLAIVLAVITRQVVLSLFIAVFVGAVMLCGGNLWEGFYSTFFDYILPGFEDTDHQRILALTTFCGGLSLLLEKNGGAQAFANAVSRGAGKTRRGAQVLTWLGGVFVWFSDSTNPVLVGPICRSFTDKVKVSREKLAWLCDCTSAPVCITLPFTSWGVYVAGLVVGFGTFATAEAGQDAVIHSIPFQLYGILTIVMIFLVALGFLPDYGPMKKAEERARTTGKVVADGSTPMLSNELDNIKPKEGFKSNLILHFLIPAVIVVVINIGTYVIMGSAKTLEAFVLAVVYQAIVLLIQKAFNIREMIQVATEGIKSVVSAMLILSLAYCINAISKTLGTSNYVISVTESWMTPVTLLALAFAVCAFMAFFTGTSWGVYAIMIPIAMPLAFNMAGGEATNLVYATIAAVMGGGCFGDHCSPLSDTTILSSLGAGSDHVDHVKTQLPYALTVAVITCIGYIIIGICL